MSTLSPLSTKTSGSKPSWIEKHFPGLPDDPNHPAQIALRTYAVALTLSLGPSLLPFVLALVSGPNRRKGQARSLKKVLVSILVFVYLLYISYIASTKARELGKHGFAFGITVAVGGGAALQHVWQMLEDASVDAEDASQPFGSPPSLPRDATSGSSRLERNETYRKFRRWIYSRDVSPSHKAFISNLFSSTLAILLLQGRRRSKAPPGKTVNIPLTMPIDTYTTKSGPSPTLDLTLLLLVRAVDATIQSMMFKRSETDWSKSETIDILGADGEVLVSQAGTVEAQKKRKEETEWRQRMTTRIDAFIFWACSARLAVSNCYRALEVLMMSVFQNQELCGVSFKSLEGALFLCVGTISELNYGGT